MDNVNNGEEFVFVSNIENDKPVRVTLSAFGKDRTFNLYQGEVKYISKSFENLDQEIESEKLIDIEGCVPVKFHKPNYIQLETFVSNGNVCVKTEDESLLNF